VCNEASMISRLAPRWAVVSKKIPGWDLAN
jgi:hypothetical protein